MGSSEQEVADLLRKLEGAPREKSMPKVASTPMFLHMLAVFAITVFVAMHAVGIVFNVFSPDWLRPLSFLETFVFVVTVNLLLRRGRPNGS